MSVISCPLCCKEKFADSKALAQHLSEAYQRLRCPICEIKFDNLMVIVKHLERGRCKAPPIVKPEKVVENTEEKTEDHQAVLDANTEEIEDIDMLANTSADEAVDDPLEPVTKADTSVTETISEDQYLGRNGQLFRRRVVKIPNIWDNVDCKLEPEEKTSEPIRSTPGKHGSAECPLCAKPLRGEKGLRLHLETAHGGHTHPCCYCARVFASDAELNAHVAERHSMPYSCVYCNKPFNNLLMAKKHVQCHKSSKKPAFQCELCHETAHTNTEIKRHYREKHISELQPRDAPTPIAPYKKGSLWYEWRGYTYHQTHTTRAGVQVLRCWVDGCWVEARVPVIGAAALQGEHTHPPYTWLRERNEMYNALRRRCMSEITPIRIIYDEEAQKYPLGAKNLPFPEPSMRMWQRPIRTLTEMSLEEGNVEWPEDSPGEMTNDDEERIEENAETTGSVSTAEVL